MKTEIRKKFVMNGFDRIIHVGYCGLWNLLSCTEPTWYTCGVYGWNADVYLIDTDTVIVTGYRPFGNLDGNPLSRKYEERAKEICLEWRWDYETRKAKLSALIAEYVKEVCGE